jgi:hypothetical protein
LHTLIVGLGRSGRGLHLPVMCRARKVGHRVFTQAPIVAVDPRACADDLPGVVLAPSLAHAAAMTPPGKTVVHLCTPPDARVTVLDELGRHGYTKVLVEKPLAVVEGDVAEIAHICRRWNIQLLVVAPWLASALTERIKAIVDAGELGALRAIYIIQRKPRFTRSLLSDGHPSAFDVEMPHSVAVALTLAGPARVHDAGWTELRFDNIVRLRMGGARLVLTHDRGVRTEIRSDLASPLRERRITLEFERATVVGHYPADHAAQLVTTVGLRATRSVFLDDALMTVILDAYHRLSGSGPCDQELALHGEVVRVLCDAKRLCERREAGRLDGPVRPEDDLDARRVG